uniref:Protein phosphatase 1 regulatory subunit 21 n=1 Tax=Cyprinus carpio TaxID=7962 RepID=A0A8C2GB76_CYPCA
MANVTDLQSKYSKLAQEYSKLRAQNQVLKKAVVDEQTASCSLKDELKQKEQSLRKVEQEMDSLSFRNQQLTKRVELLQEELLLSESKSKKSDSPSQVSLQTQSVFDEDLQKKIQENERLHIQFHEADEQFRRQEAQLRVRLDQLEKESEQHQAVVDALNRKYTDAIEKLQNDKALLEVNAQTLEREAKDCRIRTEECQQQLRKYQSEVSSQLKHSSSVIQEKVPFNDTQLSDYNSLNVPLHNRRHQLKARDVAAQALGFVQSLVSALLNLHSYTEQRVHIYPLDSSIEAISPVNLKFSQYLHENASYLRPLEEDLLQLHHSITEDSITALETLVKLQDFSRSFSSYSGFLQKILPYQLQSLEEDCEASLCTAALASKNRQLQKDMKKLTAVFQKLKSYVALLALPSECVTLISANAVFTQMSACLHGLHDAATELSQHYSQKASLEQGLPTVTQKLCTTNECLLSSLASLTNSCGKVQSESVPYREALANRHVLTSSTESREGLMQQVYEQTHLRTSVSLKSTQSKHWSLCSAQLISFKIFHISFVCHRDNVSCFLVAGAADQESREHLIKHHYMSRVSEITAQLQMCDSKAVHFHAECRAVAKRLAMAEKSRETLTEELKVAHQNITRLQDELSTTKRSYEDQLSMMSDHLCSMNDTLSKQRDEIDSLKKQNKKNKK